MPRRLTGRSCTTKRGDAGRMGKVKGGIGCRKVRSDKGKKRTTGEWNIVGHTRRGKKVYRIAGRQGLFTVSSHTGRKSYLGKNHEFRGDLVH